MKFTLTISMDNDAFADEPREEVARILYTVVKKLKLTRDLEANVSDVNGNRVGSWEIEDTEVTS